MLRGEACAVHRTRVAVQGLERLTLEGKTFELTFACRPLGMDQRMSDWSLLADTSRVDSGLKATSRTWKVWD